MDQKSRDDSVARIGVGTRRMIPRIMDTLIPFPHPTEADDPATTHDLVARRAHEIWRELGQPRNCDLAIWLEAEAEILATRNHTLRHPHCPLELK